MAIGRTFKEALMKGIRSLDTGKKAGADKIEPKILTQRLVTPASGAVGLYTVRAAAGTYRQADCEDDFDGPVGFSTSSKKLMTCSLSWRSIRWSRFRPRCCARLSAWDFRMDVWQACGDWMGKRRCVTCARSMVLMPVYKRVDTCAAEFESFHSISLFDIRRRRRSRTDRTRRR